MTYKYYEVRREVYDKCSDKTLKRTRSFKDLKRLFKWYAWVIMALLLVSMIAFIILVYVFPGKPYYLIPCAAAFTVTAIWEFHSERIYNAGERYRELEEVKHNYLQYIRNVKGVLDSCGIDSREKLDALKKECNARLDSHTKPYKSVSSTTYNMLVSVPLGAVVSSIIYRNSGDTAVAQIVGLLMFGLMIIGICKGFKALSFYADGYFKDRYLLEVLNELDYTDF